MNNNLPINPDMVFKYLGMTHYKCMLYEETIAKQSMEIQALEHQLNPPKGKEEK